MSRYARHQHMGALGDIYRLLIEAMPSIRPVWQWATERSATLPGIQNFRRAIALADGLFENPTGRGV